MSPVHRGIPRILRLLPVLVLLPALAAGGGASRHALRFRGTGSGQQDRVRIPIDDDRPGPDASAPADVGAESFTIEFWLRGTLAENGSVGGALLMSPIPRNRPRRRVPSMLLAMRIFPALTLLASVPGAAGDGWLLLSDLDSTDRVWAPEGPAGDAVVPTGKEAWSGKRSLRIELRPAGDGVLRQTWGTDVSDLRWSLESRLRFRLMGSPLARNPHGGAIFIEAGGKKGGGDSHWILPVPGETYSDPEWHPVEIGPLSAAANPGWAPDASGRLDPERIRAILFVAQQESPPAESVPYAVHLDALEASAVEPLPVAYADAGIEGKPARITPIWRGFQGRPRAHPATVAFGDIAGWRVALHGGAEARMVRSEEEPCHEDLRYQAKVTYRSRDGTGRFDLVPPRPVPLPEGSDAACAWVYGNNWDWVPDPSTPQVRIGLRLLDATGQRHRLDLGKVDFKFYGLLSKRVRKPGGGDARHVAWGGAGDGRLHHPAVLEAIEVRGGSQGEFRTIYLESVSFYRDEMALPRFRPELLEGLPFPTTADTILPALAGPATTRIEELPGVFLLAADGDEEVLWRYEPRTGSLSDLTVQVARRPPFRPCAGAGPVLLLGGAARGPEDGTARRKLVAAEVRDGAVHARWSVEADGEAAGYDLTLRPRGKSLVVDWSSREARTAELRLGRAEDLRSPRVFRVPYLNISNAGPGILLEGETFLSVLLDWYATEGSGFSCPAIQVEGSRAVLNGGSWYGTLTDGSRNPLGERLFIDVSSRFDEVLPTIPNPPSPLGPMLRERLYCHIGGTGADRFDRYLESWRLFHRKGIRQVRVSHHEDSWTDGADVGQGGQEYTMCIEASPEVGDAKLIAYCRAMRDMGYSIGLYENFTDYNPLGKSWDERNALRDGAGELVRVWPPTYAIRPLKALEMALDYPRRVAAKFGTNTAYRDCHTAYPPWGQVDFQAGSPGAGKFSSCFRAWGALLLDGRRAYGGPIFSEGGHHWFSAGLVDGNYAQTGIPEGAAAPLLVDFDLRKLHPLEADVSMTPGPGWGPEGIWSGLAATIAYGHIGFLPFPDLPSAARYYYHLQALQSRYAMVPVKEILYHRDGRFRDATAAIQEDALGENQVLLRYEGGLEVAVNFNPGKPWAATVGGRRIELSGYSWAAAAPGLEAHCTVAGGRRIGSVDCPSYRFLDSGGRWLRSGPIATDGLVALLKEETPGPVLVVLGPTAAVGLELPPGAAAEAFDGSGRSLGILAPAPAEAGDEGLPRFVLPPGAEELRIR